MASEPLLPLETSDAQRPEEKVAKCCATDKAVTAACKESLLSAAENGTSSTSLEYYFFSSQSGPVIKEKVGGDQKSKRETKSQSLQVLNSIGSKSVDSPQSQVHSCNNLTEIKSTSALVLKSAALKVQPLGRNTSKEQSISSSLGKGTEKHGSCGLMCRICHGGWEEEDLISPCKCTGTVRHAHQSCILNWVSKSGNQHCELCKFKFRTRKESVKCFWKVSFENN